MKEDDEQKSNEELWQEFLEIVNRQLEINTRLKEVIERLAGSTSKRKGIVLTEKLT